MMDMYGYILKARYLKPIDSILNDSGIKASVTTLFVGINFVLGKLADVFATDSHLIFSLMVLLILDWITGVYRSWIYKRKITSMGLRSTIVKVTEYGIFIMGITVLGNMHENLGWVQIWCYIYLAATEVKSITENIFDGDERLKTMVKRFWDEFTDRGNPDV